MLAQVLYRCRRRRPIQRVDDCELFVVDAAFIGSILTEHFFFCARERTDFYRSVRGMCVRSGGGRHLLGQ